MPVVKKETIKKRHSNHMETKKPLLITLIIVAVSVIIIVAGCKKNNDPQKGNHKKSIVLPDSTMFVSKDTLNSNSFFYTTTIYLLDAANGSSVATYSYPPDAKSLWCIPLVGNGFLYSAESDKINAININTGAVLWTDSVNNDALPILHNDTFYGVYLNTNTGVTYAYALDATKQSNTFLWKYQEPSDGFFDYSVNYYNGIIYISKFTNLTALDAKTGTVKWMINGSSYSVSSINNGIILAGYTIIDAASGGQIATVPTSLGPAYSIFYASQNLFFTYSRTSQLNINAYNITTDALQWTVNEGAINDTTKSFVKMQIWNNQFIAETQNTVYAYNYRGSMYTLYSGYSLNAWDISTGQQKWNNVSNVVSDFLIVNNTLYAEPIAAFDLYSGKKKWSWSNLYINNYDGSVSNMCIFTSGKAYSSHIQ
jgi:hypothetical protein